ncbi:MAG: hypothetical protein U0L55_01740 [Acutalibacteraceae bacterium]|nr:hypothetical protein [Acutalibacteraceae bacterium]
MLKLKDKNIKMYRGGYRPLKTIKNGKNLGGYSRQRVTNDKEIYTGTYNDSLDLFGKSGFKPNYNLCPPLDAVESYFTIDGVKRGVKITPNRDGTFNFVGDYYIVTSIGYFNVPPGTYTVSGSEYLRIAIDSEYCEYLKLPQTFTTTSSITGQIVIFYQSENYCEAENQYIQVERGETATDYRPYCGSTTSNVTVLYPKVIVGAKADIKTWCKNLLDISSIRGSTLQTAAANLVCNYDGGITGSGTANDSMAFSNLPDLHLPVGEYVLWATGDATGIKCDVQVRNKEGGTLEKITVDAFSNKEIINLANYPEYDNIYFRIYRVADVTVSGTVYFQLEKGSEPTEYEISYGRSEVSCPELFSIEVTADDPYNYTETVDGTTKYYICDTLEGNKLTRRIGKTYFDGTEDGWQIGTCDNNRYCIFEIKNDDARGHSNAICSHFVRVDDIATKKNCYFTNYPDDENNIKFMYPKPTLGTIEKWKAWLAKQYAKGLPVTVYYVLTEPTTEILTQGLKTYPKTTYISIEKSEDNTDYGMATSIKIHN